MNHNFGFFRIVRVMDWKFMDYWA